MFVIQVAISGHGSVFHPLQSFSPQHKDESGNNLTLDRGAREAKASEKEG